WGVGGGGGGVAPPVEPRSQHRIWAEASSPGPGAADRAIARLRERDPSFKIDRASWTNDRSWLDGYDDVMDPILRLSARFHERWDGAGDRGGGGGADGGDARDDSAYRRSLLTLLLSQTSCFRYWGQGMWTDMAREICRRGLAALSA